jgi:hypothetical protein
MKSVYALAAILLAANVAAAADSNGISEFHQHAMGGQREFTPEVMYNTTNLKLTPAAGGTTTKGSGFGLGVEGEWGVAERMSVGAFLGYTMAEVDAAGTKSDVAGLNDIGLFARGSNVMGSGTLAYGVNGSFSIGNSETEANGDTNAQTGGMGLTPYVGYEMAAGPGVWGAQANYNWLGERTDESGGVKTKTEEGNTLGLATFYEYAMGNDMSIGAALRYGMTGETKVANVAQGDKYTSMGLEVYAPMKGGDNLTLIPRLEWNSRDYDAAAVDSYTDLTLGVAARGAM